MGVCLASARKEMVRLVMPLDAKPQVILASRAQARPIGVTELGYGL